MFHRSWNSILIYIRPHKKDSSLSDVRSRLVVPRPSPLDPILNNTDTKYHQFVPYIVYIITAKCRVIGHDDRNNPVLSGRSRQSSTRHAYIAFVPLMSRIITQMDLNNDASVSSLIGYLSGMWQCEGLILFPIVKSSMDSSDVYESIAVY